MFFTKAINSRPMAGIEVFVLLIEFGTTFEPLIAFQYQAFAVVAGLVFLNAMECRVFRLLRLDTEEDIRSLGVPLSSMQFRRTLPTHNLESTESHNLQELN